jgi:hypothetical protein
LVMAVICLFIGRYWMSCILQSLLENNNLKTPQTPHFPTFPHKSPQIPTNPHKSPQTPQKKCGGISGKNWKSPELHKKVIWSRRLTPAVNEKWEFAGNVQFVAGSGAHKDFVCRDTSPPTIWQRNQKYLFRISYLYKL